MLRNLTLSVILVSLTPLFLISAITGYQFHIAYTSKVHAHLEELVKKHKKNIDSFLKEKVADIRVLTRIQHPGELSQELFLTNLLHTLQQEHNGVFVDLGIVNDEGIQVAYAGPFNLVNAQYSESEWFKESMQKSWYISDVFLGLRGHPHFIVAVKSKWHDKIWTLRTTIDFAAFNSLVENIQIGKTGFAFIINKKGELQSRPRINDFAENKDLIDFIMSKTPNKNEVRIEICDLKTDDYNKAIYVMTQLNHGKWVLVYRQDMADAYHDLIHTRRITISIVIIGGLTIILTAYLVSRFIVNRITILRREKEIMNEQVIETGKLASIGELAAGIAHEINNPVAIMMEEAGWMSDLLSDDDLQKQDTLTEFKRSINQIYTQGKRCKEITYKLLSFARKTDSTSEELVINQLIEEVIVLSAQKVRYSNIIINTDLTDDLPIIKASPSELQQVLLNLINNAHDAMEKTGGIIHISTYSEDEKIIIQVTDTGPGIPAVNISKIFDPFFTTKPVGKGTGLGLSICYGIIKKMKGDIEVQSIVDEGTTFTISLPI